MKVGAPQLRATLQAKQCASQLPQPFVPISHCGSQQANKICEAMQHGHDGACASNNKHVKT